MLLKQSRSKIKVIVKDRNYIILDIQGYAVYYSWKFDQFPIPAGFRRITQRMSIVITSIVETFLRNFYCQLPRATHSNRATPV